VHVPSNLSNLVGVLGPLGTLTLYLPITSTLTTTPDGNWWADALLYRLDGHNHVVRRQEYVEGGTG